MLFLLRECHLVEEEDEIWMVNTTELQVETINKLLAVFFINLSLGLFSLVVNTEDVQ